NAFHRSFPARKGRRPALLAAYPCARYSSPLARASFARERGAGGHWRELKPLSAPSGLQTGSAKHTPVRALPAQGCVSRFFPLLPEGEGGGGTACAPQRGVRASGQ